MEVIAVPRVYLVDARPRQYFTAEEYKERQAELEASGASSDTADGWDERFKGLYAHDDQLKTRQNLREHLLYMNSPDRIRQGTVTTEVAQRSLPGGSNRRRWKVGPRVGERYKAIHGFGPAFEVCEDSRS